MKQTRQFSDSPFRVNFETNPGSCNLSCIICEVFSPYAAQNSRKNRENTFQRVMNPQIIHNVFNELKATRFCEAVTTSMGEPLMYAHLDDLIALCRRDRILLHITTNGTFPYGGVQIWSKRLTAIGADVKISINGATHLMQDSIMPGANLDQVLQNVRVFVRIRDETFAQGGPRSRLTLKFAFMKSNIRELPELVQLAHEIGFDRIRGSHLLSLFPETNRFQLDKSKASRDLFNTYIRQAKKMAQKLKKTSGRTIELSQFDLLGAKTIGSVCPFLGREAWIDPEGNLLPCCVPVKYRPNPVHFGNISNKGFLPIWNGSLYRDFVRDHQKLPECKQCSKRIVQSISTRHH